MKRALITLVYALAVALLVCAPFYVVRATWADYQTALGRAFTQYNTAVDDDEFVGNAGCVNGGNWIRTACNSSGALLTAEGGMNAATSGTQALSGTCTQVPSAGAVAGRLLLVIQNQNTSTTTARCSFNSNCATPFLIIDPGNVAAEFSTNDPVYCDSAGTPTVGYAEYN